MDTKNIAISKQADQEDQRRHEDVFVRQVHDHALPAPQVLAEQQVCTAGKIPTPLFIP